MIQLWRDETSTCLAGSDFTLGSHGKIKSHFVREDNFPSVFCSVSILYKHALNHFLSRLGGLKRLRMENFLSIKRDSVLLG